MPNPRDVDVLDDADKAWLLGHLKTFELFEPSDDEEEGEASDMDMD